MVTQWLPIRAQISSMFVQGVCGPGIVDDALLPFLRDSSAEYVWQRSGVQCDHRICPHRAAHTTWESGSCADKTVQARDAIVFVFVFPALWETSALSRLQKTCVRSSAPPEQQAFHDFCVHHLNRVVRCTQEKLENVLLFIQTPVL